MRSGSVQPRVADVHAPHARAKGGRRGGQHLDGAPDVWSLACEPPGSALAAMAGRPALGVVRSSVPSAATGTRWLPATTAPIGLRSCTAIRRPCGKSASRRDAEDAGVRVDRGAQLVLADVQRGHVAGGIGRAPRAPRGVGAADAGHGDVADRDERGVAQPQPGAAEDGEHGEERRRRPERAGGAGATAAAGGASGPVFDSAARDPAGPGRSLSGVETSTPTLLRDLTTLRLGGPAGRLVEAADEDARRRGRPPRRRARASRCSSSPAAATSSSPTRASRARCVRIATRGVARTEEPAAGPPRGRGGRAVGRARRAACVGDGLAGVECLSGIPGSVGATPIQNVGAYGQEVAETIAAVRVLDRRAARSRELGPRTCGFAYRSSAFKRDAGPLGRARGRRSSSSARRASAPGPLRRAARARSASSSATARRSPTSATAVLGAAPRQGHGRRPRRPGLGQRGLVLHQPGPRRATRSPRSSAACRAPRRRRARPRSASPDGRVEDLGRLADRARGLPPRPGRPRRDRDLLQAHARAHEPRRGHDGRARRPRARDRRGRARRVRGASSCPSRCSSGTSGRGCKGTAQRGEVRACAWCHERWSLSYRGH